MPIANGNLPDQSPETPEEKEARDRKKEFLSELLAALDKLPEPLVPEEEKLTMEQLREKHKTDKKRPQINDNNRAYFNKLLGYWGDREDG